MKAGDFDIATADCTEAIRLDPESAKAYCYRGLARLEIDDDAAGADCTEAIRLDPKCALAYQIRGSAYERKGERGKAVADYAKARELGYPPK